MSKQTTRKKLLNRLNSQRNNLIKKNALLEDIDYLFTVDTTKRFGDLSTKKLSDIYKRVKSIGRKQVLPDGRILTDKYLKNATEVQKITRYKYSIPQTLKKQLNSKTFQYKNTKAVRKAYLQKDYNSKQNYIDELKRMGADKSLINRISRLPIKEFKKMIDNYGGLASFERVFVNYLPNTDINDAYEEYNEKAKDILFDVDKISLLQQRKYRNSLKSKK